MNLLEAYQRTRQTTAALCEPLSTEDYVVQTMEDVSPAKWHLAHTTWFFENMILQKFAADHVDFNPSFNQLFNSYYQSFGQPWTRSHRGVLARPTVEEIYTYRGHVDAEMQKLLSSADLPEKARSLIEVGIHHEQQHQELLLMDLKHIFSCNPLAIAYEEQRDFDLHKDAYQLVNFGEGIYSIGAAADLPFAYDNEYPRHRVFVDDFSMRTKLVTNREFIEFIEDGGYREFSFWHADAWELLQSQHIEHPMYWRHRDGKWQQFTLTGEQELVPEEPVCHVNYYEACAFANWSGARLPTEAEWEVAANERASFDNGQFLEKGIFRPLSQDSSCPGMNLLGSLWEWTSSSYSAYPGYKRPDGALGEYNSKFMVNQHVLRGGSFATPKDHLRLSYRNFYQPQKGWPFCGFRLVEVE